MCNSEELNIKLKHNNRKDNLRKCILRTHLRFSDELIGVLLNKYNVLTEIVNKEEIDEGMDITVENISYLDTKSTFSLFAEELKRLIKQSSNQKEECELLREHIVNYNKCNRCNNFLNCTCRRCNLNGIDMQYNVIEHNPNIVLGVTNPNLNPNAIDTLKTLAEFHNIKLTVYDKIMSDNYPIVGINLHRIPLGVMTNIVTVISDGLHKSELNT